jgi:hypothetical protein
MTTDTTTESTTTGESAALAAFKDRLREQARLLCIEDGYCGAAVSIVYEACDLGPVPRLRSYNGNARVTGNYALNVSAFDEESANRAVAAQLANSARDRQNKLSGTLTDVTIEQPGAPEPAAQLADDDQVTALKAKIRALAQENVLAENVNRIKVNVRLRNLGIEEIPGPKNWTFRASFPGYPGASAEYVVYGITDLAAAEAERDRQMQADRDRGFVDPSRLRLPVPPASTAVLANTQDV